MARSQELPWVVAPLIGPAVRKTYQEKLRPTPQQERQLEAIL